MGWAAVVYVMWQVGEVIAFANGWQTSGLEHCQKVLAGHGEPQRSG